MLAPPFQEEYTSETNKAELLNEEADEAVARTKKLITLVAALEELLGEPAGGGAGAAGPAAKKAKK